MLEPVVRVDAYRADLTLVAAGRDILNRTDRQMKYVLLVLAKTFCTPAARVIYDTST